MSWAEVKKINSNLNKPLDKLFGFEFFKAFSQESFTVSGVKGIALVTNLTSYTNRYFEVDGVNFFLGNSANAVVTFSKSLKYSGSDLRFIIFTLGGGIS